MTATQVTLQLDRDDAEDLFNLLDQRSWKEQWSTRVWAALADALGIRVSNTLREKAAR